ncbi:hypothetical protein AB9R00_11785, partial [Neisseria gonorrhoeae]
GGWWRQRCKNGDVWTQGKDTKYVIQFELRDSYNGHRGAAWLGAPVSEEENMGGGWWRQRCKNGDVWTQGKGNLGRGVSVISDRFPPRRESGFPPARE